MRKIEQISISAADRERLEQLVRNRNTLQKVVWRARIVLLAGEGLTAVAITAAAGKSVLTIRRWCRRYMAKGVDGLLEDATRPPRRKPLAPVRRILEHLGRWTPESAGRAPPLGPPGWPANTVIPLTYHPLPDVA